MLLVLDVGNTHTVLGLFDRTDLVDHWRIASRPSRTSDELGVLLAQLFEARGRSMACVNHIIVSSVVPPVVADIVEMANRYLSVEPLIVGPGVRTGMPIRYDNPPEVGADRIVNAVAAYELVRAGCIVVDFGTATTFDVISPQGEYLGGAIAPGITVSSESLFARAAKLPRIEIRKPRRVIGKNTVASVQSGIVFGYVALVDGLVARMRDELAFTVRVLATGGLASLIASESDHIEAVEPHLTLYGLRIIHERNQG